MQHYISIVGIFITHQHAYLITKGTVIPPGVLSSWSFVSFMTTLMFDGTFCWSNISIATLKKFAHIVVVIVQ